MLQTFDISVPAKDSPSPHFLQGPGILFRKSPGMRNYPSTPGVTPLPKRLRKELDARLVSLLETHYDTIHRTLEEAQGKATREYETFRETLKGCSAAG